MHLSPMQVATPEEAEVFGQDHSSYVAIREYCDQFVSVIREREHVTLHSVMFIATLLKAAHTDP